MRRGSSAIEAVKIMLRLTASNAVKGNASRISLVILSVGQLISWGTLYYGITFVAEPIQQETSWSLGRIFGAFSAGLLLAAIATPSVGRILHRHGGRIVMSAGSLMAAVALAIVASSSSFLCFQIGWLLAGIAMPMTLYEAAFSTLREIPGINFRRGIGVITIVGGFASTLYWPLTHWLADELGWHTTLLIYAGMHLLICFPLHLLLDAKPSAAETGIKTEPIPAANKRPIAVLAIAFALASLLAAAFSSHASLVMADRQVPDWLSMAALALIGPMQVAGRIAELSVAHEVSSVKTGMIALIALAASLLVLQFMGRHSWWVLGFAIAYGAANGVMTVVQGSILAELFDRKNYALLLGIMSAPAVLARALGPVWMAWLIEASDVSTAIWMLTLSILLAIGAYWYASHALSPPVFLSGAKTRVKHGRN
jgi:predicted MFS family arabinose efflux permease